MVDFVSKKKKNGRLLFFLKNKILKTFDSRFLKRVIFFKLFEI